MKLMKILSFVCLFLYASFSSALVIDFEEIDNTFSTYSGNSFDTKGFNLSNTCGNSSCFLHWASNSSLNADSGGVTLSHNYNYTYTTLKREGGELFDFLSIDFGDIFNSGASQQIAVTGYYSGGNVSSVIETDSQAGLETFNFNWFDLTHVTWVNYTGNYLQLDNIVVDGKNLAQVSETSSLFLFCLGILGLGLLRKRG